MQRRRELVFCVQLGVDPHGRFFRSWATPDGNNDRRKRRGRFLDLGMPVERGLYSDETARLIDDEIKQIIAGAHNEARRILREHREVLERVTRRLLEKEVMEGDELRELMSASPEPASAQLEA